MRTRLLILMVAVAVVGSGCFRANLTVDVNDDGSGTVEGVVAFNLGALEELAQAFGEDAGVLSDDDLCAQIEAESGVDTQGFDEVRPYNEDGFCGTEFSGTFAPGELDQATAGLSDGGEVILREEGDGGWYFELPFDDSDLTTEGLPPGLDDIFDGAEYVVRVRLPGRQVDHNGEIDSDGFVVWDIDLTDPNPPTALFVRTEPGETITGDASVGGDDGGSSTLTVVLIVIAVLAALGLVAWLLMRNRGGNDGPPASGVAATIPGAAPAAPPVSPGTSVPENTWPTQSESVPGAAAPPENTWPTQSEPVAGAAAAASTAPADTPQVVASPTPDQATGSPVWDPARRKYVQWDPNGNRWLVFDDATQTWGPEA